MHKCPPVPITGAGGLFVVLREVNDDDQDGEQKLTDADAWTEVHSSSSKVMTIVHGKAQVASSGGRYSPHITQRPTSF